jgi:O-antigen/teichoic acid export membrane protein
MAEVFAVHVFSQDSLVLLTPLVALLTVLQTVTAINSSALKATHFTCCALFISGFVTFVVACCLLIAFPVTTAYQALLYFTYAALISALVSCVMILFAFKSKGKPDLSTVRLTSRFVELIKVSKYVFVISLMALATSQLSVLILSSYVTLAELGRYSIALKLSLIVSYPLIIMNAITAPQYANLYEQNHLHSFKGLALTSTRLLFCLGSVGVVGLFLSVETMLAYFGEDYAKASLPLKVLLVGQWFNVATGSVVSMLLMAGYEKLHHRNTLIMTSINIISLIIFIPLYGLLAAAIITSVAMALKNLIALFYVNKLIYCKVPAKVSR